jgi:DNA-binding response OmpR family regulator
MPSILIVDDHSDTCDALRLSLTYDGYIVQVATTADAAIAIVRRGAPDFILLDYLLKGSLGATDFVRVMREEKVPSKIVLMSGIGDPRQKALQLGLLDFIGKPFEMELLIKKLGEGRGVPPMTAEQGG